AYKGGKLEVEEGRGQHNRTERKVEKDEDNPAKKEDELEKNIPETEKEEKQLQEQSQDAKSKVEERLLNAYERIRGNFRNGLAVVPVMRDSCGGCFNIIPPQRQSEIRQHKKIIVCEHCGRILVDTDLHERVKIEE